MGDLLRFGGLSDATNSMNFVIGSLSFASLEMQRVL